MGKKRIAGILASVLGIAILFTGCGRNGINPEDYVKLGEYKGVEVTVNSTEVTEEQLNSSIAAITLAYPDYSEISGALAREGDKIKVKVSGSIDGIEVEGFLANNYEIDSSLDGIFIVEGFVDQLFGHAAGETISFSLKVPESFTDKDLIGKTVDFEVDIVSILSAVPAELTDELVQKTTDYQTVDEMKEAKRQELSEENKKKAEEKKKADAWQKVIQGSEVIKFPEGTIDAKINELKLQYQLAAASNNLTEEEYIENIYNITLKEYAELMVKQVLLLEVIAEKEKIVFSDKEYSEHIDEYAKQNGYDTEEEFLKHYDKATIKENMLWQKVQQFISDYAVVKE